MYRIRFHGRGGDGMKTASRILGSSFFIEGYQVQDAPKYGAERRGAPVFAYVRADHNPIYERGEIHKPDLIVIADETLLQVTPQTVLEGADKNTVILIISDKSSTELEKLITSVKRVISINPPDFDLNSHYFLSTITSAASACLTGVIKLNTLLQSIELELNPVKAGLLNENISIAEKIFDKLKIFSGIVTENKEKINLSDPRLIVLPLHNSSIATPVIRKSSNSIKSNTGTWRTVRPVINYDECSRCMLCDIYCPDGVITENENGFPVIDYVHCKGCLICAEICPAHAIKKEDEKSFRSNTV
ncbi:MAG TPA: 2-oxoacid:acceptor oxidoreductase family protein [Spirochaetota bacterium]|nr:2-oxoacid:acceptor oxidoreductase family protein [Spirochaetota bacterium]